jgi:hypothetical protein
MSKMHSHDPFGYLKHKLWPKERLKVKLVVWLLTTKSQESPSFTCVQVMCHILLKSSQQGLKLCFGFHLNLKSTKEITSPQSGRSPNFKNFRTPTWESYDKKKWHLGVGPMARHRKYYKGEGGDFPQVHDVVSLVNPCLPMACSCTKNAPITHYPTCCLVCVNLCE